MNIISYPNCPCCGNNNIAPVLTAKDHTVSGETFEIWECGNCTIRFTQNIPPESAISKYYLSENYISHTDTNKGLINALYHAIRKTTLNRKRRLVEKITGMQRGNLLDIGAGTGAFANVMNVSGWACTGLEPDEATRGRAHHLYGITLRASGNLFELPPSSFDAVTMWHVLEHVHALHEYLSQIKKLLKPNGRLFIAVPNYTSSDAKVYKEFWAAYDVPRHLYHFSPLSMKTLLDEHGMKLLALKPMWYDSFYVSLLSEKYRKRSSNYLAAFWNGLVSDVRTLSNRENCSSLIYIVEKI